MWGWQMASKWPPPPVDAPSPASASRTSIIALIYTYTESPFPLTPSSRPLLSPRVLFSPTALYLHPTSSTPSMSSTPDIAPSVDMLSAPCSAPLPEPILAPHSESPPARTPSPLVRFVPEPASRPEPAAQEPEPMQVDVAPDARHDLIEQVRLSLTPRIPPPRTPLFVPMLTRHISQIFQRVEQETARRAQAEEERSRPSTASKPPSIPSTGSTPAPTVSVRDPSSVTVVRDRRRGSISVSRFGQVCRISCLASLIALLFSSSAAFFSSSSSSSPASCCCPLRAYGLSGSPVPTIRSLHYAMPGMWTRPRGQLALRTSRLRARHTPLGLVPVPVLVPPVTCPVGCCAVYVVFPSSLLSTILHALSIDWHRY